MHTIRLRIHDSVYSKIMWLLKRFNKNGIEVIKENEEFISIQDYLKKELETIDNGTAEFLSLEQLDKELESTIKKYEG